MTTIFTTDRTTPFSTITSETIYVKQGVTLSNASNLIEIHSTASYTTVVVSGEVIGGHGIYLQGTGGKSVSYDSVLVNTGGVVTGYNSSGIFADGDHTTIVNNGDISGQRHAINTGGDFLTVTNSGTLSTLNYSAGTEGISTMGDNQTINNSGTITATESIHMVGTGTINNSGTLNGSIRIGDLSVAPAGGVVTVFNSGVVNSVATAFTSTAFYAATNHNAMHVVNSGTFNGDMVLSLFNDSYKGVGTGVVNGQIRGRFGDDSLVGSSVSDNMDGGIGNDTVKGRGGDDMLFGGDNNDTLRGGAGDDTLDGGTGNDRLHGNAGNDLIVGGDGRDQISGNQGIDTLKGQGGNDILNGGGDDDTLSGGGGKDRLNGGHGDDILTGGGGVDVFIFANSAASGHDTVTDFQDGVDQINLSSFHLNGFADIASAISITGNSAVIDMTAVTGATDLVITLDSTALITLTATDFIF